MQVSSPERAILETLNELPQHASFHNLDMIFEGLVYLQPGELIALLNACRSVKVQRLFFVYADRHQHAWHKYLDDSKIDFGSGPRALVKIETSSVTRGTVHPTGLMVVSKRATQLFGFMEANVLAFEDVYGGKLVAALDRLHPRDLFDVKIFYYNEGLTDKLFRTFLIYVASSRRPMHEILAPENPQRGAIRQRVWG